MSKAQFNLYNKIVSSFFDSTLLRSRYFNGSILVAKNGVIVYEKYSGLIDLRKKDPITETTPLHIASTSKTLTAMAILQMVQEKKLSLSDTLGKFFPGFPYYGITVKMLLSHRSGLPNYLYFISANDLGGKKYITNKDVLDDLYTLQPKESFPPNTHFSYSNTNFVLLALIIEKISGETFPAYMKERFFQPLQMKNTYVFTIADSLTVTPSFYTNGRSWKNDFLEGTYGDKNVYTTPRDLLKWDEALNSGRIINKVLLDSAYTPYSLEKRSIHNYGLGWRLAIFPDGKKLIYHFGRWHGFNAALAFLPAEGVTIIILGNRFTYGIYNAAHRCVSLFGDYWQKQQNMEEELDSSENLPPMKVESKNK